MKRLVLTLFALLLLVAIPAKGVAGSDPHMKRLASERVQTIVVITSLGPEFEPDLIYTVLDRWEAIAGYPNERSPRFHFVVLTGATDLTTRMSCPQPSSEQIRVCSADYGANGTGCLSLAPHWGCLAEQGFTSGNHYDHGAIRINTHAGYVDTAERREGILSHEFGHVLGLTEDPTTPCAVMGPSLGCPIGTPLQSELQEVADVASHTH